MPEADLQLPRRPAKVQRRPSESSTSPLSTPLQATAKSQHRPSESSTSFWRPFSTTSQAHDRELPSSKFAEIEGLRIQHHGPFHLNLHLPTRSQTQSKFTGTASSADAGPSSTTTHQPGKPSSTSSYPVVTMPTAVQARHSVIPPIVHEETADATPVTCHPTSPQTPRPTTLSQPKQSLLRTPPPPPSNPRNHTLLEIIYNETHASRFINLAPLSLLRNLLGLHFKGLFLCAYFCPACSPIHLDVRTNTPLMVTFPPLPPKHRRRHQVDVSTSSSNESSDPDNPHDVLSVSPPLRKSKSMRSPTSSTAKVPLETLTRKKSSPERRRPPRREEDDPEDKWLSMRGLIKGASPYVLLDGTHTAAYSPSAIASHSAASNPTSGQSSISRAKSNRIRLPNSSLNFDLRTLNIHLALRATEILACAEAMWDWVTEYQERIQMIETGRKRAGSVDGGESHPSLTMADDSTSLDVEAKSALETMTRAEFDSILTNFDL
jgi:hypothetical protein